MRCLFTITFLALSPLLVVAHDAQPDAFRDDSPSALIYELAPSIDAQEWHEDSWEKAPLVQRWRQWVRRQDRTEASGDQKPATDRGPETKENSQKADPTTQKEEPTTQNKAPSTEKEEAPTTQAEVTTTNKPASTTQEPTTQPTSTQESSAPSTVLSTSSERSSTSSSTTSTTISTIVPGASCYSTTVDTSVICSITTGGRTESVSCITAKMTSSTCSPGLLCQIHPDSGVTVCMEQHNDVGTEGIVVGAFFGACIAGCIAVLVGMCLKDKRAQKKYHNMQRVKTLRKAAAAAKKPEDQTNLMSGPSS